LAVLHPMVMMGCHFQDRPCKPCLCLRGLQERWAGAPFAYCEEPVARSCPHRGWDHGKHLEICKARSDAIDPCPGCGGRHRTMIETLRCEIVHSVRRSFKEDRPGKPIGERLPSSMKASVWRMIRDGVIERDGSRCRLCGKDLANVPSWMTEVHHVRPKSAGGADHPTNLITLCAMCHRRITVDAILASASRSRAASEGFLPQECLEALR